MKKDKISLYALEILLIFVLLALFVLDTLSKSFLAFVLAIFSVLVVLLIKNKKNPSYFGKQIVGLMCAFGFIYLIVFYLLGLYFGYYKSPTVFGLFTIYKFIVPFTVIIISSEIIRYRFIQDKSKISKTLTFISMVSIDLIIYTGVYNLNNLEDFLAVVGFILFASIACNLLYNYISVRFGIWGIVVYRLLIVLYCYFIPYIPNVYIFLRSFLRMIYPFIIYLVLEYTFSRSTFSVSYKDKNKNIIGTCLVLVFMALLIGLISCQFRFGIIVIGSGSMTGSINKGDAVVFEQFKGNEIEEEMVIIFNKNEVKTVHRVAKIEKVNGFYQYYTKGDANATLDDGYVTNNDILGIVKFRVAYIGWPSIWIRNIFE